MDILPASRITVQNGSHLQTWEHTAEPRASQRELSQDGPSAPNTIHKKLFTKPHSPFSIQWIEIKVGNAGTAQGSTKISSSAFVHQPGRMKKPDSINARKSFTLTPNARKIIVLTTVFR